ncbi:hypothetical protein BTVI_118576 [Pitangus sulphuratus]|nr:hypothetical protein BTVI_118576 [Pitangus sulphuratus]
MGYHPKEHKLEKWARVNLIKFNKSRAGSGTCIGTTPNLKHRLGYEGIERSPAEKDVGVLVDGKQDMSCQCTLIPEGHLDPGLHQKKHGRQVEGGDPFPGPLLDYSVQLWGHWHRKDMGLLKQVQRRATEMVRELGLLSYEDSLRELRPFSLQKRRLHPIVAFQYLKGGL